MKIGVQTKNIIDDNSPLEGYLRIKNAGFDCADFSLNYYLTNKSIYQQRRNNFFDKTNTELEAFFTPHRSGAQTAGICLNQIHMPYPILVPNGSAELNDYLWHEVAPKSLHIAAFLGIRYVVVHGFKLVRELGSEVAEWAETEKFIRAMAPLARELNLTICIENIYGSVGNHIIEGPCCNARLAAERIDCLNDEYGAEILGFCFDTGHANLVGIDFFDFISTLGSRLKVLHIHDNDGIGDLHQIPFTFTRSRENKSSTDWGGFIRGLQAIKFNGVLSFETAPVLDAFPSELKDDALKFIAKIGRYFASQINPLGVNDN